MKPRYLSLVFVCGCAWGQGTTVLSTSPSGYELSIPYIESAASPRQAYSARLTSTAVPDFTLDAASLQSIDLVTGGASLPSYASSASGLRLTLPWVEFQDGSTTRSYAASLISGDGSRFTVEQATPGPAWAASGGSCRPARYEASSHTVLSGALTLAFEDISQREGMQHVRLTNTSSQTLFFALEASSTTGRIGLMAPQPGTVHLSPGESLVAYIVYYNTDASTGTATYDLLLNFSTLDTTSGRPTGTTDSLQRSVSFTRQSETPLHVTDASTPLSYTRVAQATAQVGFWRYKVDDAEARIVLFPGQENWSTPSAVSQAQVVAYTLDGELLWTYAPGNEVWGGDMSPDGRWVAFATLSTIGGSPSRLVLLDAGTGTLVQELSLVAAALPTPADAVVPTTANLDAREVRFSPDGTRIAVGTSEGRGYLFSTEGLVAQFAVQTEGQLRAIEFKGDALYLGAGDGWLHKVSAADGQPVWKAYTTAWPYSEPAFSSDASRVVVGAKSGGFTVLDTRSGACVFSANHGTVRRAFFTPDDQHIIAATGATNAGTIAYRASDGVVAWRGPMSAAATVSADSRYTLMADGPAWIMDGASGQRVATLDPGFNANANYFKTAYLSKDGSRAVVARRDLTPGDVAIAFFLRQ